MATQVSSDPDGDIDPVRLASICNLEGAGTHHSFLDPICDPAIALALLAIA